MSVESFDESMRSYLLALWRAPLWIHFSIAIGSVFGIVASRFLGASPAFDLQPYMVFTIAVGVSAFCGGLWPGVAAAALSLCISTYSVSRAQNVIATGNLVADIVVAAAVWLFLSIVCDIMRREALAYEGELATRIRSQSQAAAIVEAIQDPFAVLDGDWQFVYVNDAYVELYGLSAQELKTKTIWDVVQDPDGPIVAALQAAKASGRPASFEAFRGGHWFQVRVQPHQNGMMIYGQNADARKKLEEQREALLVMEREARRLAEDTVRLKDDFLFAVSHELRTPLTAILGWTEMLSFDSDPQLATRGLQAIDRSAKAQAVMVEQLLDVAHLATGAMQTAGEYYDIAEAIEVAVNEVRRLFVDRGSELTTNLAAEAAIAHGDMDQTAKALLAVLDNAFRYSPPGSTIKVSLSLDGASAVIGISDSGQGIAPDIIPYLFDRFRRDEVAMRRKYHGLGLGLAIAHGIIDTQGGFITISSEGEGRGTTVQIILPLSALAQEKGGVSMASASPLASLRHLRILLVDDDPSTLEILTHLLTSFDAKVQVADCGRRALDLLGDHEFDVLVSDLGMPDMTGLELMEVVRSTETLKPIRALALSAYSHAEVQRLCREAGFDAFATKPIERAKLLHKISNLVGTLSGAPSD